MSAVIECAIWVGGMSLAVIPCLESVHTILCPLIPASRGPFSRAGICCVFRYAAGAQFSEYASAKATRAVLSVSEEVWCLIEEESGILQNQTVSDTALAANPAFPMLTAAPGQNITIIRPRTCLQQKVSNLPGHLPGRYVSMLKTGT